jgi:hypothetical protein
MAAEKYELQYGYMHCVGRTTYSAGTADTEEQARDWVSARTGTRADHPGIPGDDPIRWCPVRHCHMKCQKPWFAYRKL